MDGLSDDRLNRELEEGFKDDSDDENERSAVLGAGAGSRPDLNRSEGGDDGTIRIAERTNRPAG